MVGVSANATTVAFLAATSAGFAALASCEMGEAVALVADTDRPQDRLPTCELMNTIVLADGNTLAPTGRTGNEMLARVPASFESTLAWDLATEDVEVVIEGVEGVGTPITTTFRIPADPVFIYEDWELVEPELGPSEERPDIYVSCADSILTQIGATVATEDGTLAFEAASLRLHWIADEPGSSRPNNPTVVGDIELTHPLISFVRPEMLVADDTKELWFEFGPAGVEGALVAQASGSEGDHLKVVARW